MDHVCGEMAWRANERVHRIHGEHLNPPAYGFGVSHYRTYGALAYCDALSEFHEPDVRATTP